MRSINTQAHSHLVPAETMCKSSTHLKDLKVGDLIYADIIINIADVADSKSKSTTMTK